MEEKYNFDFNEVLEAEVESRYLKYTTNITESVHRQFNTPSVIFLIIY
jgi:hypothetical protein